MTCGTFAWHEIWINFFWDMHGWRQFGPIKMLLKDITTAAQDHSSYLLKRSKTPFSNGAILFNNRNQWCPYFLNNENIVGPLKWSKQMGSPTTNNHRPWYTIVWNCYLDGWMLMMSCKWTQIPNSPWWVQANLILKSLCIKRENKIKTVFFLCFAVTS